MEEGRKKAVKEREKNRQRKKKVDERGEKNECKRRWMNQVWRREKRKKRK